MTIPELQAIVVLPVAAIIFVIRVRTGHAPRWMPRRGHSGRFRARFGTRTTVVVNAVVVGVVPWLVYVVARPHVDTAAEALMIGAGVPLVWAVGRWVRCRHVDAAGVMVVVAYAGAVALSILFGGAALPLKLRDVAALAVVGLGCLVSVAIRRPLLFTGLRVIARRGGSTALRARMADPATRGDLGAATVLTGTMFLGAAATDVLLIATVSTSTFLAVAGPLGGLTPIATIAAAVALVRHRSRRRSATSHPTRHQTL